MPYGGATQPMNKVCTAASLASFTQKAHMCIRSRMNCAQSCGKLHDGNEGRVKAIANGNNK